jgi:hypothetical protein
VDAVLKVYKKVRMYAVSGFVPKPLKITDFRRRGRSLGAKQKNLGGDEKEMETEQENIENSFKDANEIVIRGGEEMVTKKKKITKTKKAKKTKVAKSTAKSSKSKRTVKTPKGSGTVTRSAVAKAAKKVTSKRSATKKNR